MGRSNSTRATSGHNSGEPLTDEEVEALATYYSLKIRAQQRIAAQAKADYDLERGGVNGLFKKASGDLKYTRKELEDLLAKQDMTEAEFRNSEAKRAKLYQLGGLPVGAQIDMFANQSPDTVDDKIAADIDGYRAGRRADDPTPPSHVATFLHPDWLGGWNRGQEVNAMQLAVAEQVLARVAPGTLGPDDEDEAEADEEFDDAAEAKRLAASGWTEPTAEEATFN